EQQLTAILQLVPERDGWKPPVVRTVATENQGTADFAREIARFRAHFSQLVDREAREIAHWKEWLLRLLQARLMERVVGAHLSAADFDEIAREVAARRKDPYAAVAAILAEAGLS
ncbi:MAG: hypothetical protein WBE88_11525, partial [Candidatus Acidiferrales bacterium]